MKKRLSITIMVAVATLFGTVIMPHSTSAIVPSGPAPLFQDECVVVGDNNKPLRVRATPGGRVIGSLRRGAHIVAYGWTSDSYGEQWVKIRYRRGVGYVSARFVFCGT